MCESSQLKYLSIHMTNIHGAGAVNLSISILPHLLNIKTLIVDKIYVPHNGLVSEFFRNEKNNSNIIYYKRWLPNALSRLLECTLFGNKFESLFPLLVFGDIPLRVNCKQTLFIQNSLLFSDDYISLKNFLLKFLFKFNLKFVDIFIVQTEVMKLKLQKFHPDTAGKIRVIGQPAPNWIDIHSNSEIYKKNKQYSSLKLIYPANFYPHKNHKLLSTINHKKEWPVSKLLLTVDESLNPARHVEWIKCVGFLSPPQLLDAYLESDALLFLSLEESLGFPLIEAMYLGRSIVCPDLPYAHTICGDQAIYFQPNDLDSLQKSLIRLNNLLDNGWLPCWEAALSNLPGSWREVANSFYMVSTH